LKSQGLFDLRGRGRRGVSDSSKALHGAVWGGQYPPRCRSDSRVEIIASWTPARHDSQREVGIRQEGWIGSMKDTMDIVGDIVSPVIDEKDIEALRD
jgi:hypothetical protein